MAGVLIKQGSDCTDDGLPESASRALVKQDLFAGSEK